MTQTLERIERALSEPLDPEREAWRVTEGSFIRGTRGVERIETRHRQIFNSFLTGTSAEVIYSNVSAGAAINTFTTEVNMNATASMGPLPILPPFFFMPSGSNGKVVRVIARGILSTTGSPTFTFSCRGGAALNVSTTPQIAASVAVTAGATQTNSIWEAEWDTQLTVLGAAGAGNSTIRSLGIWTIQLSATTSVSAPLFGAAASPGTVATLDIGATNNFNVNAACGTSSVSNAITLLQLIIMGLN